MRVQSDVALAPHSTMGVGGPARWFVDAATEDDVAEAIAWARARGVRLHVLGGGSNVVFADEGFAGLVLRVGIHGVHRSPDGPRVRFAAGAGEAWDPFVACTVAARCAGLECLSGIPGFVGGTPVQNVGAYGQEVAETITHVHVIDRGTSARATLSNAACAFGYRTSRFKTADAGRFIVTRVEFALRRDGRPRVAYQDLVKYFEDAGDAAPTLSAVRAATLAIRRRKGMVIEDGNPANRSCGSFFVNPVLPARELARLTAMTAPATVPHYAVPPDRVKVPAAWLIEQAGFSKGTTRGPVGISPFQAQAIVNLNGARAADVLALALAIKRAVWETFRVVLVPEPVFVGFADTPELRWLLAPALPSTE